MPGASRYLVSVVLVLQLFLRLQGQEMRFSRITSENGLSMGVVNCVLRDSRGFMWFGTQDGLNKFDGYNMSIYKHNPVDSSSISNNFIYSLYEDRNGKLWIGTNGGGLSCYDLNTGKFSGFVHDPANPASLSNNSVRCIMEDKQGTLWIGTDEGLNRFDRATGKFIRYRHSDNDPSSLSGDMVWCLRELRDGRIAVGTYGAGLNILDRTTGKFVAFMQKDAKGEVMFDNADKVRALYEDASGNLWIGTYGEGVQVLDPKSGTYLANLRLNEKDRNSLSNDRVTSITGDASGIVWIGTYGGGISLYDPAMRKFRHLVHDEQNAGSLGSNQIKYVMHDSRGDVWIGTEGGGVSTYFRATGRFRHFKKNEKEAQSLRSNVVLALMEDADGLLWIGTSEGGVSTFDRSTHTYKHYPALCRANNNSVLCLLQERDGTIWAGSWGGGLISYDKRSGKTETYPLFQKSSNGTIVCLYQDRNDLIWIGTYGGGLFSYDKKKKIFTQFTEESGLASNNIYSVLQDRKGRIWIGTEGGGLNILTPSTGVVKRYLMDEKSNSISSNTVNHVYEAAGDVFWIATASGLNRLDLSTEHFEHYSEKDGLPNDYIYCVLPDKRGNLWMTTNNGVVRMTPPKDTSKAFFRSYDVNDGLQGKEHNQGAFFLSAKGEMFAGGVHGFTIFDPQELGADKNVPSVRIVSYKRFGEEIPLDTLIYNKRSLDLSWQQNFFSFEFVANDYHNPGKVLYSYKLEGVDDHWSPPGTQRFATYTELRGGDYIFRVRVANRDGVWNDDGVALHIHINPPFWQTPWFYTLCILATIAAFWGFVKFRTRAIQREKKVLEEKVEERTRELAQKNKDITSSIQYAKRIQLAILPPLEQIDRQFPDSFIVYRPKDIVSGDFYWFGIKNGRKIIAAVDCTGHGVPGAFMSMIGHNLLNQIIIENGITEPDEVLNALHRGVQAALKQGSNLVDTSDGMDVAICAIDEAKSEISYAGAYRPLFIFNSGGFGKIEADKYPIGGSQLDVERKFTAHVIPYRKGDTLYMSSDGYADQFGGEKGKKFMLRRFIDLLRSIQDKPMKEQGRILEETIESWRGDHQQVDDILVVGIRF